MKSIEINSFRLCGICYSNPKTYEESGNMYATNTLVITGDNEKKYFIPIMATGENAIVLSHLCRNGNKVMVQGDIKSKEHFNKSNGTSTIRVFFNVREIFVIKKMKQTKLNEKRIQDLTDLYGLD